VHSCYEAGRDGWWLHRWLSEQGIDNLVVDSASIEVNRRARRAKTDRLDGDKLLVMLRRHHAGERVWSVLHEPTPEQEDARRTHRELARLTHERTAHMNRIRSLLVLHNLRVPVIVGGRDWAAWWERDREHVPPVLRGEIERESARLALVKRAFEPVPERTSIRAGRGHPAPRAACAQGALANPGYGRTPSLRDHWVRRLSGCSCSQRQASSTSIVRARLSPALLMPCSIWLPSLS
jgi:hypothetical protein